MSEKILKATKVELNVLKQLLKGKINKRLAVLNPKPVRIKKNGKVGFEVLATISLINTYRFPRNTVFYTRSENGKWWYEVIVSNPRSCGYSIEPPLSLDRNEINRM